MSRKTEKNYDKEFRRKGRNRRRYWGKLRKKYRELEKYLKKGGRARELALREMERIEKLFEKHHIKL